MSGRGPVARGVTVAAMAALMVGLWASPAAAHAIGGVEATNYRTEITGISPPVAGLTFRVRDLGGRFEAVNDTGADLVVLGYQNEPYLRVGPAGVFENRRSPSLYQDRETRPGVLVSLPPEADPTAPPEWHRRSGGRSVSWPDHRIRWGQSDPESVRQNPGVAQTVVSRWIVPFTHDGSSIVITGRIAWVPGPAAWPWFAAAAVLFGATVAAANSRRWAGLMSGALAVLLAVDAVRLYGAATAAGGSVAAGLARAALAGVLEIAALAGGLWAIGALQQRKAVGAYAAMAVGMVLGFVSGVGDLLNLAYSQVPTSLPVDFARAAVPVCLGIGFGLLAGGFLALRNLGATANDPLASGVAVAGR
ncbi:MAG: hypothetical protein AB1673_14320 [Actinomycetota bacterium]